MKRILHEILHPFADPSLPPSQNYSPLDVRAEMLGKDTVDALFTKDNAISGIARLFCTFLGSSEAELSLRKGVHTLVEDRLRRVALAEDPAERYSFSPLGLKSRPHPLDALARTQLGLETATPSGGGWRFGLSALCWWFAAVTTALWVWIRFGKAAPETHRVEIASQDFWSPQRWQPYLSAFAEAGVGLDRFALVLERGESEQFKNSGITLINPATAPVHRSRWWRESMGPLIRLGIRIASILMRHRSPQVQLVAYECLHQAMLSLRISRIAHAVSARAYLDIVEYNPIHNLKAVILGRHGTRLIRLPHSEMDGHGFNLSYLGYDSFLSGGGYQGHHLADGWSPRCINLPVGMVQNDRRTVSDNRVAPEVERAVSTQLAAKRKMLVYFGSSSVPGIDRPVCDLLAEAWRLVQQHDDWFLLIKPKVKNAVYQVIAADPRLDGMLDHPRVVAVRYAERLGEPCPVGWVLSRMALGISIFGSVQLEALCRGRQHLSYYPVPKKSPLWDRLINAGILYDNVAELGLRISQLMSGQRPDKEIYDWVHQEFDPFGDHEALTRVARVVLDSDTSMKEKLQERNGEQHG